METLTLETELLVWRVAVGCSWAVAQTLEAGHLISIDQIYKFENVII
jgi:hypothetical protein